MKMDGPRKKRSLALRVTDGYDLEDDEMSLITRVFKKYLWRGKNSSRNGNYNKTYESKKQVFDGCFNVVNKST